MKNNLNRNFLNFKQIGKVLMLVILVFSCLCNILFTINSFILNQEQFFISNPHATTTSPPEVEKFTTNTPLQAPPTAEADNILYGYYQRTGKVILNGQPSSIIFDGSFVWIANETGNSILKLNPETGKIERIIDVGSGTTALFLNDRKIWFANKIDNTIQYFDLNSDSLSTPISVGKNPTAITFDGQRIWVANYGDNTVQAIDPRTESVEATIEIGLRPTALAYDGKNLWIVCYAQGDCLIALDPITGDISIGTFNVGDFPSDIEFDGTYLWIAVSFDNKVVAVDPFDGSVVAKIDVGSWPIHLMSNQSRLWVLNLVSNSIQYIDKVNFVAGLEIPTGLGPSAATYENNSIWVVNYYENTIQNIDPSITFISQPINVGQNPISACFDGTKLWITDMKDKTLSAYDPVNGSFDSSFYLDGQPYDVLCSSELVWVTNPELNLIQIIEPKSDSVKREFSVGAGPMKLLYDGKKYWVSNWNTGTLQYIDNNFKLSPGIPMDFAPFALAFDKENIWVGGRGNNQGVVQSINAITMEKNTPIYIGNDIIDIIYVNGLLWVANQGDNAIYVIDPELNKLVDTIPIGQSRKASILDLEFDGNWVWAILEGENYKVVAIEPSAKERIITISSKYSIGKIYFDGTNLWLLNSVDGSLQYILK